TATGAGFLHVAIAEAARVHEAVHILESSLKTVAQKSAEGARLSIVAGTSRDANEALGELIAAGIELADFSMGSPSLDEVFFALTGKPGSDTAAGEKK
ncbi:MAG: daunorubicin/doxorubicin resistance ABC transporter ATP-binding protein DrrA, partial [Fuerstia sp.]|nr:daunorubicin/doxorubicin resistance ABC transporter ATP-binding protein DrrA [Fuerstiella sp.]